MSTLREAAEALAAEVQNLRRRNEPLQPVELDHAKELADAVVGEIYTEDKKPKYSEYKPFDRDGRLKVSTGITHWSVMPCTHPRAVTEASARRVLDQLWNDGFTNHSGMGSMLWVPITWCVHNNRAFEVWKWQSGGICSYFLHLDKLNPSISKEGAKLIATLESVQEKKNNEQVDGQPAAGPIAAQ